MASGKPKPYTKIAILGNFGHGKTTLIASLAKSAGRLTRTKPRVEPFGIVAEIAYAGLAVNATVMKFRTAARKYAVFDFATQNDAVKGLVAGPDVDGVILVVSAADGLKDEACAQVALARKIGVKGIVVVLTMVERAQSKHVLLKHEGDVRVMLAQAGFDAVATTIAQVSSKPLKLGLHGAGIRELLGLLDSRMPTPTS
jgi:translation elongation factor EF-Tu-like GTPase